MPLTVAGVLAALVISSPAIAECGSRGGPGYRGPDGKCVGWANIGKVCGNPPTTNCTPEMAHPNAPGAADHGAAIEALRPPGGAVGLMVPSAASAQQNSVIQCAAITNDKDRLQCFDRAAGTKKK
jgi:hypothetical protein